MPEMTRKKATVMPTLKPMMAPSLRLACELCAALCETCASDGRIRTEEVEFSRSDVVVLIGLKAVVFARDLNFDDSDIPKVVDRRRVKVNIKDVQDGVVPMTIVGVAAVVRVESFTRGLLDVARSELSNPWPLLAIRQPTYITACVLFCL
jgi:hypothetical protein